MKTVTKIRRNKHTYGEIWPELSKAILRRDGHKCTECRSTKSLSVHHIVPLSKGGRNIPFNLKALCATCHSKKHSHLR